MSKLYRSRSDRWIAGVCGGLGKFFGINSTIIRIIFFLSGGLSGVYILLWIFIPENPSESNVKPKGLTFGKLILVLIGGFILLFLVLPFIYFLTRNLLSISQ